MMPLFLWSCLSRFSCFKSLRSEGDGAVAQLARAPALQAGGRRFDSDQLHNNRELKLCTKKCRASHF